MFNLHLVLKFFKEASRSAMFPPIKQFITHPHTPDQLFLISFISAHRAHRMF